MSPSSDSSARPFDETVFQLTDSDALIDWLVRYDEALEADVTDRVPLGTTIEEHGALEGLRYCVDLLRELRDSAPTTSDSARSRFQNAIDHWLVTGRTGPVDLSSKEIYVGRYRLLKEIGRGGYGVVFLAS